MITTMDQRTNQRLDAAIRQCDVAYRWPDQMCCTPIMKFAYDITQGETNFWSMIQFKMVLALPENIAYAAQPDILGYVSRQLARMPQHVRPIPAGEYLNSGDIVFARHPGFSVRGSNRFIALNRNYGDADWLHFRGDDGMLLAPLSECTDVHTWRLVQIARM